MFHKFVLSLVLLSFVAALIGCGPPDGAPKPPPKKPNSNTT